MAQKSDNVQPIVSQHTTDMSRVYGPLGYLKELFLRYNTDLCPSWAASLSFFSILSIAPILLCALAVLGFLIHDPHDAAQRMLNIIDSVVPDRMAAEKLISDMKVEESARTLMEHRGTAGIVGVLSLFWAALQIFVNALGPMNAAFRAKETRNWLKQRLVALGLLFGAGALFLLSLLPSFGASFSHQKILSLLIGLIVNAAMFTLIYRFLPSPAAKVSLRAAAFGGAIVSILWEIAKEGFGYYVKSYAHYDKLYGSFGGLIGLIFWIYYSSMILLLGAEIAKLYQDARAAKGQAQ